MRGRRKICAYAWAGVMCAGVLVGSGAASQRRDVFAAARDRLVKDDIVASGIRDRRVIESIRTTPRHMFVPMSQRRNAYYDMALPIGAGQRISPPYVVAFMTEKLAPQPDDRVLEIGTGSGYQAAVLSPLVRDVYTIEIVDSLGRQAARTLRRLGYKNVHTKIGDGYLGWREHAPFDKIIVTCSPEEVPQPLVDQLVEGGRLVVPLGERFQQMLYLFKKADGKLVRESLEATFFVPMTGEAETQRARQIDESRPRLQNVSFEETIESSDLPLGWFYVRQGQVTEDAAAVDGQHVLTFANSDPGRAAHAMQAFGVDGREVSALNVSLAVSGERLKKGPLAGQEPSAVLEFYGSSRAPVGRVQLGPWSGDVAWETKRSVVSVPERARLAVIGVGLFGATGTIAFDNVSIMVEQ